jgi:hypothetical protein
MMNKAVAHFALDSGWVSEVRELGKDAVTGVPPVMVFMLETCELAAWAGADNDLTQYSRRLFRQSTRRPK